MRPSRKIIIILIVITIIIEAMTLVKPNRAAAVLLYQYVPGDVWIDSYGFEMSQEHASLWLYFFENDGRLAVHNYGGPINEDGSINGEIPSIINGKK